MAATTATVVCTGLNLQDTPAGKKAQAYLSGEGLNLQFTQELGTGQFQLGKTYAVTIDEK